MNIQVNIGAQARSPPLRGGPVRIGKLCHDIKVIIFVVYMMGFMQYHHMPARKYCSKKSRTLASSCIRLDNIYKVPIVKSNIRLDCKRMKKVIL